MKYQNLKTFYEKYHSSIIVQKKIIGKRNFTYRLILNVLEPFLNNQQMVLDIGCGTGTLSFYIANKGDQVIGIDISSSAIEACQQSAIKLGIEEKTKFFAGDLLRKSFKNKFDLVLFSEVLEHMEEESLILKKIFKLLSPDGKFLVTVPSTMSPLYRIGLSTEFDKRVGHLRRYSLDSIVKILKKTGFKILTVKKTEGLLRNFFFVSSFCGQIIRLANRFSIISDLFTFIDNITLKLFGEAQIIVVAQKPGKENK